MELRSFQSQRIFLHAFPGRGRRDKKRDAEEDPEIFRVNPNASQCWKLVQVFHFLLCEPLFCRQMKTEVLKRVSTTAIASI